MPRPSRCRRICDEPAYDSFAPCGTAAGAPISLTLDEYESIRLIDLEKKVGLILEGQTGMNEKFEKLDTVAEDVEEIKLTVRAMEAVTQRNSNDIRKLRAVK